MRCSLALSAALLFSYSQCCLCKKSAKQTQRGRGGQLCDAVCQADARCYAERYHDLKDKHCPRESECLYGELRRHYKKFGEAEGRSYGCSMAEIASTTEKKFLEKVTTQELESRCYLQRYADVRERFCKPSELLSECVSSSQAAQIQRYFLKGPAGRHFGCNSRGG